MIPTTVDVMYAGLLNFLSQWFMNFLPNLAWAAISTTVAATVAGNHFNQGCKLHVDSYDNI